jgi:hypothetical protein
VCVTGHSLSFALLLSLRAGVTLRRRRAAVQCVRTRSSTFAGQHACGPLSLRRTVNSQHRWSLLQYREFLGWSPKRGRLAHPIVCSNHWMARCQQVQSRSRLGRGCCSARARGREGGGGAGGSHICDCVLTISMRSPFFLHARRGPQLALPWQRAGAAWHRAAACSVHGPS